LDPNHQALAKSAAAQGFVLLKNENGVENNVRAGAGGTPVLPFNRETTQTVAVLGPHAKATFAMQGEPQYAGLAPFLVSPCGGIQRIMKGRIMNHNSSTQSQSKASKASVASVAAGAVCVVPPGCAELTPGMKVGAKGGAKGSESAEGAKPSESLGDDVGLVSRSICFDAEANTAVEEADAVVLLLGLSPLTQEREELDRKDIKLPAAQLALVKASGIQV
jgi:hypothetical protein